MLEVVEKFYDVWVIKKSMKMDFHWYWNFTFLRKKLKITLYYIALYQTPSQAVLIKLFVERSRYWIFFCCDCDNFRTEMQWVAPSLFHFFSGGLEFLLLRYTLSYENFWRLDNNLPTHIPQKCLHRNVEGGREVIPPVIFVWGGALDTPRTFPASPPLLPRKRKICTR